MGSAASCSGAVEGGMDEEDFNDGCDSLFDDVGAIHEIFLSFVIQHSTFDELGSRKNRTGSIRVA